MRDGLKCLVCDLCTPSNELMDQAAKEFVTACVQPCAVKCCNAAEEVVEVFDRVCLPRSCNYKLQTAFRFPSTEETASSQQN